MVCRSINFFFILIIDDSLVFSDFVIVDIFCRLKFIQNSIKRLYQLKIIY